MTKYVYHTRRGSPDIIEVLKYKVVYENSNFSVIIAKSGTKPIVIENREIVDLSTDSGKSQLANIMIDYSYWGTYFDRNPYKEDKVAIIEAKTKREELRLAREISDKNKYIEELKQRIEQATKEAAVLNKKLSSINEVKMEVVDDTASI